jgi:outer membrane receptor protein involved in Fe transport
MANATLSRAEGQHIASALYLFTAEQLADRQWQPFDHDQTLTANVAFDLHDRSGRTHFSASVNYGSGLRTGPTNRWRLPAYATVDISLRHRFDFAGQPEVALDVRNLFDDEYALRIGNGALTGSAYGPGLRFGARITMPLRF